MRNKFLVKARYDFDPVNLFIFSISYHHHYENDKTDCIFRSGVEIKLFNFLLAIGMFSK